MAPPKNVSDNAPVPSIAQTKLERQNKRYQELDPTVNTLATLDKRTHQPRGKKNKWQPLDLSEFSGLSTPSEGGVPVSEVRVNTFRAPSRGSDLSRPVSVLSHHTSETGPSDMDRQDSALTDQGFQVYQRRRGRKNFGDLNAYEDKPEERQTTVEATFDAREVYNVFGNALPGPDVLNGDEGHGDGEVRFVQHPTGDIVAHQWSSERFMWENIGQFSGHRKRVEGQLAADRLKGETAHQSLQRNTLAYFRLIAKQREANVMGKIFALKEIQAALPEPRTELSAAPTGLREGVHGPSTDEPRQTRATTEASRYDSFGPHVTSEIKPPVPLQSRLFPPQDAPTGPRADRYNFTPNYLQPDSRQDDPFYSVNSYRHIYGGYPSYSNVYYRQPNAPSHALQATTTAQKPAGLQYDFY